MKEYHEIRDPLHIFIRLDSDERKVLDSYPFQRLRYIHQLALSYLGRSINDTFRKIFTFGGANCDDRK